MPQPSHAAVPDPSSEKNPAVEKNPGVRLQKFLAMAGVDSRRNCETYILEGRVTVDGKTVSVLATTIDPVTQKIALDGERLRMPRFRYYLLNKPKGVLCTNSDPQGRPRAIDLVPARDQRLFTVGRLDENTHGLLLLTNNGDLAERLAHPRYEVVRRYRVQVVGVPTPETIAEMIRGMHFSEGLFRFRGVTVLKRKGRSTFLELELREGRNREIRRLLARAGHKVIDLQRVAFGPLRLGHIAPGRHRELRPAEIKALQDFADGKGTDDSSARRKRPPAKKYSKAKKKESVKSRQPAQEQSRRGAARTNKPLTRGKDAAAGRSGSRAKSKTASKATGSKHSASKMKKRPPRKKKS